MLFSIFVCRTAVQTLPLRLNWCLLLRDYRMALQSFSSNFKISLCSPANIFRSMQSCKAPVVIFLLWAWASALEGQLKGLPSKANANDTRFFHWVQIKRETMRQPLLEKKKPIISRPHLCSSLLFGQMGLGQGSSRTHTHLQLDAIVITS